LDLELEVLYWVLNQQLFLLGGLDVSVNYKGLSQGNSSSTAAKENLLPNELMQTIDKFK